MNPDRERVITSSTLLHLSLIVLKCNSDCFRVRFVLALGLLLKLGWGLSRKTVLCHKVDEVSMRLN